MNTLIRGWQMIIISLMAMGLTTVGISDYHGDINSLFMGFILWVLGAIIWVIQDYVDIGQNKK